MPTQGKAAEKRNRLTLVIMASPVKVGHIWEYRICMPMTVEEYQIAQLYSVAEASKNETGGGEGIEVLVNEPFTAEGPEEYLPKEKLIAKGGQEFTKGQYTKKIYHLASKVPGWLRMLAPSGSLEILEEAWNAYPYCRTVISNPGYMKENFYIVIESFHDGDRGEQDNIHDLDAESLKKREVHIVDIADRSAVGSKDYKEEWDPNKVAMHKESGRGPIFSRQPGQMQQQQQQVERKSAGSKVCGFPGDWSKTHEPIMCCYKLVRVYFKWFGLQNRVEKFVLKQEKRIFTNFHRQVYCWTPGWYGMTMEDIREIERKTKEDLDKQRAAGELRGTKADED